MSDKEAFEQIREEIANRIGQISDLADAHEKKLSEIEKEIGTEKDISKLLEKLEEIRGLKSGLKRERVEAKQILMRKLLDARIKARETAQSSDELDEIEERFDDVRDSMDDDLDDLDDKIDSFEERVEELRDSIKERIRETERVGARRFAYAFAGPSHSPRTPVISGIRIPEIEIPDVGSLIEESLSRALPHAPSVIVSSVRLPQADLNLIDALVESGIFKSRNEGIAFFAHRGIEGSKEWLANVKEKLDEIRRLQDETKKELDTVIGESATKTEEKKDASEDKKDQV